MAPVMRFLVAWLLLLAVVDLGYSLGWPAHLRGGSISLEAARLYRDRPWSRAAFLAVSILLIAALDRHFATYGGPRK